MNLNELNHKRRTVSDLIRFIGNTSDYKEDRGLNTPNYSILLGSGASITSGIRSGQHLIESWKHEVYDERDENKIDIPFEEYFSPGNAPDWYEENNAYSTLFENRFDLQRHRRMFVEHEVAGKTPSIGYAYLVKLIEQGFFNTIFTTNFDDLLNEAFYRFSKNRPIVCAHDSSISGISVTSMRPKIIKLHGDYLFDNIKTTLKETESLESNMKMKFQEFAKDYGLIVVGYSGNDRSIMDILTYLLQDEDYFKNGIYWCIRKEDQNISSELKKLLWRDRVYFIEIDGFDELFAEINYKLNNGVLPIDDSFLSRAHQEKIINDLTENKRLNIQNKYLADDCKKLKDHYEDKLANDFLKFIRDKKTEQSKGREYKRASKKLPYPKLSSEEKKELNDLVTEAYGIGKINSVLQKLQNKNVFELTDSSFKIELLELEADLKKEMKDEDIKKYYDELIRLNPNCERYYEIAAKRSSNKRQSIEFLSQACAKFKNDYYIINSYVSYLIEFWNGRSVEKDYQKALETIEEKIKNSIQLYPYIENKIYSLQIEYIKLKFADNTKKLQEELDLICKDLVNNYKYHPHTLKILRLADSKLLTEALIKDSLNFYLMADNENYVEKIYIELITWYYNNNNFEKVLNTFEEFENDYTYSDLYLYFKGNLLMEQEYFETALSIFNIIIERNDSKKQIMTIFANRGKEEELTNFYENLKFKEDFTEHYLHLIGNHKALVDIYNSKLENQTLTKDEVISLGYSLLKLKDYQGVITLLKPYYENPQQADGVIIVNYQFARLKYEPQKADKIKSKVKEKIFDNKYIAYSDFEKLGAACIIGDLKEIQKYLNKVVKKNAQNKYIIKDWPIMEPFLEDQKISSILTPDEKFIKNRHD